MSNTAKAEQLFIRLYLDAHIKARLAEDLQATGFDALTAQDVGKERATDEEHLIFATQESRAILTFNIRHFAPLHQQWTAAGRVHAGIIVSRQLGGRQYGVLLQRVLRLLNQLSADDMRRNLVYLEQFK